MVDGGFLKMVQLQDGAGVTGQPGPRGYGRRHLRLQRGVALERFRGFEGTTLEVGGGQGKPLGVFMIYITCERPLCCNSQ